MKKRRERKRERKIDSNANWALDARWHEVANSFLIKQANMESLKSI